MMLMRVMAECGPVSFEGLGPDGRLSAQVPCVLARPVGEIVFRVHT